MAHKYFGDDMIKNIINRLSSLSTGPLAGIAVLLTVIFSVPVIYITGIAHSFINSDYFIKNKEISPEKIIAYNNISDVGEAWNFYKNEDMPEQDEVIFRKISSISDSSYDEINKTVIHDILKIKTCIYLWNHNVRDLMNKGNFGAPNYMAGETTVVDKFHSIDGIRHDFGSQASGRDICGSYFVPQGIDEIGRMVVKVQESAIQRLNTKIDSFISKIEEIIDPDQNSSVPILILSNLPEMKEIVDAYISDLSVVTKYAESADRNKYYKSIIIAIPKSNVIFCFEKFDNYSSISSFFGRIFGAYNDKFLLDICRKTYSLLDFF